MKNKKLIQDKSRYYISKENLSICILKEKAKIITTTISFGKYGGMYGMLATEDFEQDYIQLIKIEEYFKEKTKTLKQGEVFKSSPKMQKVLFELANNLYVEHYKKEVEEPVFKLGLGSAVKGLQMANADRRNRGKLLKEKERLNKEAGKEREKRRRDFKDLENNVFSLLKKTNIEYELGSKILTKKKDIVYIV